MGTDTNYIHFMYQIKDETQTILKYNGLQGEDNNE